MSEIEYENVTVPVPKKVLDFFCDQAKEEDTTLADLLQRTIVDDCRSILECKANEEWSTEETKSAAKIAELSGVFWEILADKEYEPKRVKKND